MSAPKMTPQEISDTEIRIIRWGEKVLTPLLIAGVIAISGFLVTVNKTVAQLEDRQTAYVSSNTELKVYLSRLEGKIEEQSSARQKIELAVERVMANQTGLANQVDTLQDQNMEIIRLLRGENGAK
jgi:hypothetical protein